jgi:hypothetical protein
MYAVRGLPLYHFMETAEQVSVVVTFYALYSEGPCFDSWSGNLPFWQNFRDHFQPSSRIPE